MHNIIRRNLDIIVQYNLEVKCRDDETQQKLFVDFCSLLMSTIHGHHLTEEECVFPTMSKGCNIDLEHFVSDHKELNKIWDDIIEKLKSLSSLITDKGKSIPDSSSTDVMEGLIQAQNLFKKMQEEMIPHLKAEEDLINTELVQKHFSISEMKRIEQQIAKVARNHVNDASTDFAFIYYSLNDEEREIMNAKFPWIVTSILLPYIWKRRWSRFIPMFFNYK